MEALRRKAYTVGQINSYIKNMFTQDFVLKKVCVKGEVSNCKYHSSGHIYFSLKDSSGSIACIMFAGMRAGLAFHMENGQQVEVLGSVNVYERDGRYQLYASEITLGGIGLLYERFEALKRELAEMGMFAPEYKQEIPRHVRTVGIVTAPTGAAIRDIMNISLRRNPYVQLILCPALVQGEGAADSIVQAIERLDAWGVDVMIVGRGGGSIEDLWAFNEEKVARAIFHCNTPVISAVGHETDVTIADFVADLRAPTPSAAAELAVEDISQTQMRIWQYRSQLVKEMMDVLERGRERVDQYEEKLEYLSPQSLIREERQRLMEIEERLGRQMEQLLAENRRRLTEQRQRLSWDMERQREQYSHRLALYIEKLKGLSPLDKLSHGYAYVSDGEGKKVLSVGQMPVGGRISVHVRDGSVSACVEKVYPAS